LIEDEIDSVLKKLRPNLDKMINTRTTLKFFTSHSNTWHYHIILFLPRCTTST